MSLYIINFSLYISFHQIIKEVQAYMTKPDYKFYESFYKQLIHLNFY